MLAKWVSNLTIANNIVDSISEGSYSLCYIAKNFCAYLYHIDVTACYMSC